MFQFKTVGNIAPSRPRTSPPVTFLLLDSAESGFLAYRRVSNHRLQIATNFLIGFLGAPFSSVAEFHCHGAENH